MAFDSKAWIKNDQEPTNDEIHCDELRSAQDCYLFLFVVQGVIGTFILDNRNRREHPFFNYHPQSEQQQKISHDVSFKITCHCGFLHSSSVCRQGCLTFNL